MELQSVLRPATNAWSHIATIVTSEGGRHIGKRLSLDISAKRYGKLDSEFPGQYFIRQIRGAADLRGRYEVRHQLSGVSSASLLVGEPNEDIQSQMSLLQSGDGWAHFISGASFPAQGSYFRDTPRPFLHIDLDGFRATKIAKDFNARLDLAYLPSIIEQLFKEIGWDCLIVDHVQHISSSYGLLDDTSIRVHIDVCLRDELTLAQQRKLVELLNRDALDAGFIEIDSKTGTPKPIFDPNVYSPNRLLFTSKARIGRIEPDGTFKDFNANELAEADHFDPVERVRYVDRGRPHAELPPSVLTALENIEPTLSPANHRARRRASAIGDDSRERISRPRRIGKIAPGATHGAVVPLIGSIADGRVDRAAEALEHYRQAAIEQIKNVSADEEDATQRLHAYTRPEWWAREYQTAYRKFLGANQHMVVRSAETYAAQRPTRGEACSKAISVSEARTTLEDKFKKAVDEALNPPAGAPPKLTIIRSPAGVGKSTALSNALPPSKIVGHRLVTMVPTLSLADQVLATRKPAWEAYIEDERKRVAGIKDDADTHLRSMRGRRKLCIAKGATRKAAEAMEMAGRSAKPICDKCKWARKCKYIAQDRRLATDNIMQHAHLLTYLTKLEADGPSKPTLIVADESIISLMLAPRCSTEMELETLRRYLNGALVRKRSQKATVAAGKRKTVAKTKTVKASKDRQPMLPPQGDVDDYATTDVRAYGAELLQILDGAGDRLEVSQLAAFKRMQTVADRAGGPKTVRRVDLMLDATWIWIKALQHRTQQLAEALVGAIGPGSVTTRATLQTEIDATLRELDAARFAVELYRAIRMTLNIPAREKVLGVRLYTGDNGARFVHAHVRSKLPKVTHGVPMIMIDGTADMDLVKAATREAGHETVLEDVPVAPPVGSYHLTQYPERPFGKSGLVNKHTGEPTGTLWTIWRLIWVEATRFRGVGTCLFEGRKIDGLIGVQQDVEAALIKMGLPDNVAVLHFGNERGVNAFRGIKFTVIVGRPMPDVKAIEDQTEALHADNEAVIDIKTCGGPGDRIRERRTLPMVGGGTVSFAIESLPDPDANRMMLQHLDAPVAQMSARGRVYDRGPDTTLIMHVFGQADIGLPIHEALRLKDAERDAADLMLALGIGFEKQELAERMCEQVTGHQKWVWGTHGGGDAFAEMMRWFRWQCTRTTGEGEGGTKLPAPPLPPTENVPLVGKSGSRATVVPLRFKDGQAQTDGRPARSEACWIDSSRYKNAGQAIARYLDETDIVIEQDASTVKVRHRPRSTTPSKSALKKRRQRERQRARQDGR